ncbi:MAG: hypothetical protein ABWZ30_01095 [Jiangellaceae bacterium]
MSVRVLEHRKQEKTAAITNAAQTVKAERVLALLLLIRTTGYKYSESPARYHAAHNLTISGTYFHCHSCMIAGLFS